MSCVTSYNIVRDGDIRNDMSAATYEVSTSGISNLYDAELGIEAYQIQQGKVSSLVINFGESFDVCAIYYYCNPIIVDDFYVSYWVEDQEEEIGVTSVSGSSLYTYIGVPCHYIRVTHSGSTDVSVYQIVVESRESELFGFGESKSEEKENIFIRNSPIGHLSSSATKIPVYNDNSVATDIGVSAFGYDSEGDPPIYLGLTSSGVFYGYNDNGLKQPGFVPISILDESFVLDDFSELSDRGWKFYTASSAHIKNMGTHSRFVVDNKASYGSVYREANYWNFYTASFFQNDFYFTPDQSFTISLDIRFAGRSPSGFEVGRWANKFMFGFSNSFPLMEYGLPTSEDDYLSYERPGRSLAAIWIGGMHGVSDESDLYVGAAANDADFSCRGYTNFNQVRAEWNAHPILCYKLLESFSKDVLGDSVYTDGAFSAPWRTLKVSYDHTIRTAYYYLDDILVYSYCFSSRAFTDVCKVFFGHFGVNGVEIDFRNFVVKKDVVQRVYSNSKGSFSYGGADLSNQGEEKISDSRYGSVGYKDAWVSGYNPTTGNYFGVFFDSIYSIEQVRLKRPSNFESITISGSLVSPPRYSLDRVFFYFDTGDVRYVNFFRDKYDFSDWWDIKKLRTLEGTFLPVVGATSVLGVVDTLHDYGEESKTPVFVIEELQFCTVSGIDIYNDKEEDASCIPWSKGLFNNLEYNDSVGSFSIRHKDLHDISSREKSSNLLEYSDYGGSKLRWSSTNELVERHYAETVFRRDFRGSGVLIEANLVGETAWIWRFFEERSYVGAVLFTLFSSPQTGYSYRTWLNKWKVQKLKEGGNPNWDGDWLDIAPITKVYPGGSGYSLYTQYLVNNNDGEYYTDFIYSMESSVTVPEDSLLRKNKYPYAQGGHLSYFGGVVTDVYVEFDEVLFTSGIRLVFEEGFKKEGGFIPPLPGTKAEGYTLNTFVCFSPYPTGSYTSPVFDTNTKLNTERIYVEGKKSEQNISVMYRGLEEPPGYRYDPSFENWEDLGCPYSGLEIESSSINFFGNDSKVGMVPYGDYIYCFTGAARDPNMYGQSDRIILYNTLTHEWSFGDFLVEEFDGAPKREPDIFTRNNTCILGDSIVLSVSSVTTASVRIHTLLKYKVGVDSFGNQGWSSGGYQRQPEAVRAAMVSDNNNRIFFLSIDGTITVFYLDTNALDTEDRKPMPLHGGTQRGGFVPAYHDGLIYVVGGSGGSSFYFDIYDIEADTWMDGGILPYDVEVSWCFYYGGFIYSFPYALANHNRSIYSPILKYDIKTGLWEDVISLGYNYKSSFLEPLNSSFTGSGNNPIPYKYCLHGDYVYALSGMRKDFRRTKLKREPWVSGNLPSIDDYAWRNVGGAAWSVVPPSGELLPQEKYLQYKVVIRGGAEEEEETVVKKVSIVQPLVIEDVPASGVSHVYTKTGVGVGRDYEMFYIGYDSSWDTSVIRSFSVDGKNTYKYERVLEGTTTSGGNARYGYSDANVWYSKDSAYESLFSYVYLGPWIGYEKTEDKKGSLLYSSSTDGYLWDAPLLSLSTSMEGTYDTTSVYGASTIKDSGYSVWYTAEDIDEIPRILFAYSTDCLSWTTPIMVQDINTNVLRDGEDTYGSKNPTIIKDGGKYYMWYEGVGLDRSTRIIYCFSDDGITWEGHSLAVSTSYIGTLESFGCGSPCVIYKYGVFYMWFSVYAGNRELIYYAYSNDGKSWFGYEPIMSDKMNGSLDANGISSFNVVDKQDIIYPTGINRTKLRMYNV